MKRIVDYIFPKDHSHFVKFHTQRKIFHILVITLLLLNFILLGLDGVNKAVDPEGWDTSAYLGEANFIHEHGGVTNFLNLCSTGNWKQGNQNPLYILLITPFASTQISFFIIAKIISLSLGFFLLLFIFIIIRNKFGYLPASIAVFGMIMNNTFLEWTTVVACESSLILFSFLAIGFIIEGFRKNKYWAYAGIFAGLSYLSKASGLFIIPGFVISALFIYNFKILKNKYFWSFFILFIVTASPILIRNTIVYKNPFFNTNEYIVKYGIDKFNEIQYVTFDMDEGSSIWKFDEIGNDNNSLKSSNNNVGIAERINSEIEEFLKSYNILQKYLKRNLSLFTGIFLTIFFLFGLKNLRNRGGRVYLISTILVFLVLLSFNPIDRYFLPLMPWIWICIALGFITILDLVNRLVLLKISKINLIKYIPHSITVGLILFLGFNLKKDDLSNPLNSVEYSKSRQEILNWLKTNLNENDKYTLGPNFYWQINKGMWILPPNPAKYNDITRLQSFVKRHDVKYIILDKQILTKYKSLELIKENFLLDAKEGILEINPIDNWSLINKDKSKPVDFLIYEVI